MPWLWIVGPLAVALIYFVTAQRDRRLADEAERWSKLAGARKVGAAPSELTRIMLEAGQGTVISVYEILPRIAYLGVLAANSTSGSDQRSVAMKLAKAAPTFVARPLPILDGERIKNDGVQFAKDPGFGELFLVEGTDTGAITKWLTRPLRDALRDLPDAWLHVSGRAMALTLYGPVDAERIDALVEIADALFAEHGAEGGPSLLGDDDDDDEDESVPEPAPAKPAKKAGKGKATAKKGAPAPKKSAEVAAPKAKKA